MTVQKDSLNLFDYLSKILKRCSLAPTQKPVPLVEEIIKAYTNEGDIVLNSTAGSMTTGVQLLNQIGRLFV